MDLLFSACISLFCYFPLVRPIWLLPICSPDPGQSGDRPDILQSPQLVSCTLQLSCPPRTLHTTPPTRSLHPCRTQFGCLPSRISTFRLQARTVLLQMPKDAPNTLVQGMSPGAARVVRRLPCPNLSTPRRCHPHTTRILSTTSMRPHPSLTRHTPSPLPHRSNPHRVYPHTTVPVRVHRVPRTLRTFPPKGPVRSKASASHLDVPLT